jgi:hypothetical protein
MKTRSLYLVLGLMVCIPASGMDEIRQPEIVLQDFQSLINNSPFQSAEFKQRIARAGSGNSRQIAFHGYVKISNKWLVALRDNESQEISWVKVGDEFRNHTVSSFNPRNQRLTLTREGNEITLNLDSGR